MSSILSRPCFHNEEAAYAFVEQRLWPKGATCPKCGERERVSKMGGKSTRIGAYKCYACRKPFTVKVGTIFESSHIALRLWLQAIYLISSSKKGISSHQLSRTLGITVKSAWFMSHRIREAMRSGNFAPFGSNGGPVEVDETFIGNDRSVKPKGVKKGRGYHHKNKVLALVDRTTGQARSMVVDSVSAKELAPLVLANVAREARLMTDDANYYVKVGREFSEHGVTRHTKGEYVSKLDPTVHTNTIEGFFSVFKRGMKGVYQHCGHHHLNRYLAEFDFRYNNRIALGVDDVARADNLLLGVAGRRLTYKTTAQRGAVA